MGLIVLLAALALWPGLHGGFLFDDFPNLEPLGAYGAINSWPALARYATSGAADPTGRPVAIFSFLIDARNWPADPYPFKRTNLLLHLLNGILLSAAIVELGRAIQLERRHASKAAVLAAGLWMLHPLFVSTTMYIVQREAMLPATFTFLAIWAWLATRRRVLAGDVHMIWWMVPTVMFGTVLAILSKANGILLPVLLLVIECCLPPPTADAPRLRRARNWLLVLPTIVLCVLVLKSIPGSVASAAAVRPWTLWQRLLTEPRIVFDYLGQLWIPRPFSRGLFNDGYALSQDLWHPWTTLPALLGIAALALAGWLCRNRSPAIAMAIGFYLVGQSIESGPFALELYFEHRNYLPAALMFWPLAVWLTGAGVLPGLRRAMVVVLPLLFAAETWMAAGVWGNSTQQALLWGARNPDSPRAQAYEAQHEQNLGQLDRAEQRLRSALKKSPMELQLLVNLIGTRCAAGGLSTTDLANTSRAFREAADPTRLAAKWLEQAMPVAKSGACDGLGIKQTGQLAQAFADNPRTAMSPGRKSDAEHLLGEVALAEGEPLVAKQHFDRAYAAEHKLDVVLVQSAMLAAAGQSELALAHLDLGSPKPAKPWYRWNNMGDVNAWVMYRQGFWQQQIDELRGKIDQDLRDKQR